MILSWYNLFLAGVEGIRLHTLIGDCLAVDFNTLERLINRHEEVFADQLQPLKPIRWEIITNLDQKTHANVKINYQKQRKSILMTKEWHEPENLTFEFFSDIININM